MNVASCCKYPYPCIILLHCSLITSLFSLIITGCGEGDSKAIEITQITPEPGTRIGPREQFTVRFNTPIIPSSGAIKFGDRTFTLPYSDLSDTITWNRCFSSGFMGTQVQLIMRDFEGVDSRVQAKAFQVSYSAFASDIDPPTIIEQQPGNSRVDPAITREIRVTFDRPIVVEFKIDPPIDGTSHVTNDDIQCTGVARWVFADTEQLRYATEYRIVLGVSDAAGHKTEEEITFTTKP